VDAVVQATVKITLRQFEVNVRHSIGVILLPSGTRKLEAVEMSKEEKHIGHPQITVISTDTTCSIKAWQPA
jgi:uncharacterized protein YqfA (UPF0365 family)